MRLLTRPSSSFENDTNVHTKFWNEICLVTFDKWICCNEMEPSQSHEKKPRGRERVEKRDSLSAVFCQGRNYTLTDFFLPRMATIDHTSGFTSQFPT